MSRAVIISGMHRSGTSLISSLVQRAGIHIGEKLLGASPSNPRGYFEDLDFYEFHDRLLHERGQTYLHVDRTFAFDPTAAETEHARRLIAERIHRPLWGWKDPRTCLFLDFWIQLLPDARFLFVYRHPIDVLLSLLRRGEFDGHPSFMAGLNAWHTYNSNILTVCNRYPDRCLLVHIDGVTKQPTEFFRLLQDKLQLDSCLDSEAFDQFYHSNELHKTSFPGELTATLARLFPEVLELYQQLNLHAKFRNDEVCTDSAVSPHFAPFAYFTEALAAPASLPVKNSLLQLVLWLLAPEPVERILTHFNQSTKEAQCRFDKLWSHAQYLHRLNTEQQLELERRSAQIAEQKQQLNHQLAQVAEQQYELDRRSAHILEQQHDFEQAKAAQQQELDCLQRVNTQQSQTIEGLQWLNLEHSQELERRAAQIETLEAELKGIYGTPAGKALRTYRSIRDRWTKAA